MFIGVAKMSKLLNDVIVCCENKKVYEVLKNIIVSQFSPQKNIKMEQRELQRHIKRLKKYDLVVDIQGDEPLVNPTN